MVVNYRQQLLMLFGCCKVLLLQTCCHAIEFLQPFFTSNSYDEQGANVGAFDGGVDGGADGEAAAGGATAGGVDDGWTTTDGGATTKDSDDKWSTDDDWSSTDGEGLSSEDEEEALTMHVLRCQQKRRRIATAVLLLGMYHCDKYMKQGCLQSPT